MITVHARWRAQGTEHTGVFKWNDGVKAGDILTIWVDNSDGNYVGAPTPTSQASVGAVGAALAMWLSVIVTTATLMVAVRFRLNRLRNADWERELRSLADDGGRTSSQS
jgi:hypothetical protein